jgi:hypothetical protein
MPKAALETTRPSDPAVVDAFLKKLKHPQAALAAKLRAAILAADRRIGEEINRTIGLWVLGSAPPYGTPFGRCRSPGRQADRCLFLPFTMIEARAT